MTGRNVYNPNFFRRIYYWKSFFSLHQTVMVNTVKIPNSVKLFTGNLGSEDWEFNNMSWFAGNSRYPTSILTIMGHNFELRKCRKIWQSNPIIMGFHHITMKTHPFVSGNLFSAEESITKNAICIVAATWRFQGQVSLISELPEEYHQNFWRLFGSSGNFPDFSNRATFLEKNIYRILKSSMSATLRRHAQQVRARAGGWPEMGAGGPGARHFRSPSMAA